MCGTSACLGLLSGVFVLKKAGGGGHLLLSSVKARAVAALLAAGRLECLYAGFCWGGEFVTYGFDTGVCFGNQPVGG